MEMEIGEPEVANGKGTSKKYYEEIIYSQWFIRCNNGYQGICKRSTSKMIHNAALLCDQVIFIQYDCEMPVEHPSGNVKWAVRYSSLDWSGYIDLELKGSTSETR